MSEAPAGWYPDPAGHSRLRYWDGRSWTAHYVPAPQPAAVQAETGQPRGTGTAQPWGAGTGQPWAGVGSGVPNASSPRSAYESDRGSPYGSAAGSPYGGAPDSDDDPYRQDERTGSRTRLVAGIIIGALVVIGLLVAAAMALLNASEDGPAGISTPTAASTAPADDAEPAGEPVEDGGSISVGEARSGALPAGGEWTAALTVTEPSPLVLEARALDGADLVLEVRGPGGFEVRNDDRPDALGTDDTTFLDPAVPVTLAPGEYEVRISEYDGLAGEFSISAVVPHESLDVYQPATARVPAGEPWTGLVVIEEAGTYGIDVRATDDADAVLALAGPGGEVLENDDSDEGSGDSHDPYLSVDLEPGRYVLVLGEFGGEAAELAVRVVAE